MNVKIRVVEVGMMMITIDQACTAMVFVVQWWNSPPERVTHVTTRFHHKCERSTEETCQMGNVPDANQSNTWDPKHT